MNRRTRRYEESLAKMPEPILLSQSPKIELDLRGLMQYAKKKGVKVIELTEREKVLFVKE